MVEIRAYYPYTRGNKGGGGGIPCTPSSYVYCVGLISRAIVCILHVSALPHIEIIMARYHIFRLLFSLHHTVPHSHSQNYLTVHEKINKESFVIFFTLNLNLNLNHVKFLKKSFYDVRISFLNSSVVCPKKMMTYLTRNYF